MFDHSNYLLQELHLLYFLYRILSLSCDKLKFMNFMHEESNSASNESIRKNWRESGKQMPMGQLFQTCFIVKIKATNVCSCNENKRAPINNKHFRHKDSLYKLLDN